MSIHINEEKCKGCGRCLQVCPGGLIDSKNFGKARITYPKRCWGCTACIKECPYEAIELFLGREIGGTGTKITAINEKDAIRWKMTYQNKESMVIPTFKRKSNQY